MARSLSFYSPAVLDFEAYLARIGLRGRPGIAQLHRAHVISIPFENLDPQRGVPVSLALGDVERKLVADRRGGYCFEQNLLLKAALEALGVEVDMFLARVRSVAPPGVTRPRTHLVLRARSGGTSWHVDVGFGHGGPFEPLPFGPGATQVQSGWRFRIVLDGAEFVLQSTEHDEWVDLYGFVPEPVPFIDVEVSNWFACTHPRSPFVIGLVVSTQHDDGTLTSLSNWSGLALTEQTPTGKLVSPVAPDAVPELLEARFGLPGFILGADGRFVPSTDR
jgi:N-hydroxyarylamine O-acetyltransferase